MNILSTVYFEKIFPSEFHKPLKCIQASQSRMTLQDALKLPMGVSWLRASEHYLTHIVSMYEFCQSYPHTSLTYHPDFAWSVDEKHCLQSTCWLTDIVMCHMINGFVSQEEAKKCKDVKEANKHWKRAETAFCEMNKYVCSWQFKSSKKPLPFLQGDWSVAKSHYCKAMQAFMGMNYSLQEENQKTLHVATKKMEEHASYAIQSWSAPEAYDALNIARCCRAMSEAIQCHPTDRGFAIGLCNAWLPLLDKVDVKAYPKTAEWFRTCKEMHKEWVKENNQIYFEPVPDNCQLKSIHINVM